MHLFLVWCCTTLLVTKKWLEKLHTKHTTDQMFPQQIEKQGTLAVYEARVPRLLSQAGPDKQPTYIFIFVEKLIFLYQAPAVGPETKQYKKHI